MKARRIQSLPEEYGEWSELGIAWAKDQEGEDTRTLWEAEDYYIISGFSKGEEFNHIYSKLNGFYIGDSCLEFNYVSD